MHRVPSFLDTVLAPILTLLIAVGLAMVCFGAGVFVVDIMVYLAAS